VNANLFASLAIGLARLPVVYGAADGDP